MRRLEGRIEKLETAKAVEEEMFDFHGRPVTKQLRDRILKEILAHPTTIKPVVEDPDLLRHRR